MLRDCLIHSDQPWAVQRKDAGVSRVRGCALALFQRGEH